MLQINVKEEEKNSLENLYAQPIINIPVLIKCEVEKKSRARKAQ